MGRNGRRDFETVGAGLTAQERAEVTARLRARSDEIEAAMLIRIRALAESSSGDHSDYAAGQRAAVAAGLEFGLEGIERYEAGAPVPEAALAQARLAARSGVGLDAVLRRYLVAYTLFGDFVVDAVEDEFPSTQIKQLLRSLGAIVDELIAAVSEAYEEESARRRRGAERRYLERVERLLLGAPVSTDEIAYDFDGHHLGLLAGPGSRERVGELASHLGLLSLPVPQGEEVTWAWLGSSRYIEPAEVIAAASDWLKPGECLALGEPAEGLAGWRRSHHQARAVWLIARRRPGRVASYAKDGLLATVLADEVLAKSLLELYVDPLLSESHHGEALIVTLRAYLTAERNVSSAAAAVGVSRRTVANRLRNIEEKLGVPLFAALTEIDLALRLQGLQASEPSRLP